MNKKSDGNDSQGEVADHLQSTYESLSRVNVENIIDLTKKDAEL